MLDLPARPKALRVRVSADQRYVLYVNGTRKPELAERAGQAAEKALALAPGRPEGYLVLGYYQFAVAHDNARAMDQYARGQRVAPGNAELISAAAIAQRDLGHWDAAVEDLRRAERLDPRSVITQFRLGQSLFWLRRFPEAREAYDRGLSLAPANIEMVRWKAMTFLGEGDLAGARAVLSAAPKEVEPTTLVAHMGTNGLGWVLDEKQRELLLRLTPSAFEDDRADWAISLAQAYALKGDQAKVHLYAEEARKSLDETLRSTPGDTGCRICLALALAYLGRREEAIREGERAAASTPVAKDAVGGADLRQQLATIYTLAGEAEKALDELEFVLKMPSDFSPGWLKIDPEFDPLRKNPRFQRLLAQGK